MKRCYIFLLLLFGLLTGCIDPVDLKTEEGEKRLVVRGMITNEPGPYTIQLNKTAPYGASLDFIDPSVLEATVIISDDLGNSETLETAGKGIYTTSATGLKGEIGRTYTLSVTTKDGKNYKSTPQLLQAVPAIESIYFTYKPRKEINSYGVSLERRGIEIGVLVNDPGAEKNYYRWRYKGTYKVETQPEDYYEMTGVSDSVNLPKDCCHICWVYDLNKGVNVSDDRLVNGNVLRYPVVWIPTNSFTFNFKYHIEFWQYSLSEAEYDYWELLKNQASGNGTIQDQPPAKIKGNLYNVADSKEEVLGFFGASGLVRKTRFIDKQELPIYVPPLIFGDDCRVLSGSTTIKPAYWQ